MHNFTPIQAMVGGALLAVSLSILLITTGRIAGASGIFAGLLHVKRLDWAWRAWFVGGMMAVGVAFEVLRPSTFDRVTPVPMWVAAVSGLLVGLGVRAGNGCTSGHGICGISRLSKRSIVATMVFFGVGVGTATIIGMIRRGS